MNIFTRLLSLLAFMTILFSISENRANAQCSGLTMQVAKDSIGAGNVKYTYYVNKDSACTPYRLKLKVGGYPAGMIFKYYIGTASPITSNQDTFSTVLNTSGYYDVKVELINNLGSVICTISRDSMVRAGVGVKPNIVFTPKVLCNGPDTVTIIDSTPGIVARIWKVDGVTYSNNSRIIKHKFSSVGCKTVEIFLTSQGDSCQLYKKIDSAVCIYNSSTVNFSAAATQGCKAFITSFTPNVGANGNTITQYDWTFSNASPANYTGQNTGNVTFPSAGSFDVGLSVKTSVGCTYSASKTGYINVGDTFNLGLTVSDTIPCRGNSITAFTNTSNFPSGGTMTWKTPNAVLRQGYGSDSAWFVSRSVGLFTIQAELNYNGCKSSSAVNFRVAGPMASFSLLADQFCKLPAQVKFLNNSAGWPGLNHQFWWKISDSTGKFTNLEPRIYVDTFVYNVTKLGSYSVKLFDSSSTSGCLDSIIRLNTLNAKSFVGKFIIRDSSNNSVVNKKFCACEKVIWKNNSQKPPNDSVWINFQLFYKMDTTNILKTYSINATRVGSVADTIAIRYCDTGTYLGRMIIQTDAGCQDTVYDTVFVSPPKADFIIGTKSICKNGSITLTQTTQPNLQTLIHKYYYKHKDSTNWVFWGTGNNVSRSFTEPGVYSVAYRCESKSSKLCGDSLVKLDSIYVNDISFDFKSAATSGCKGSVIKFDTMNIKNIHPGFATSTYHVQWSVSPSSGVTIAKDTLASTNITFANNGVYDITLTLTDNKTGCSMIVTKNAMITVGVTAGFSIPGSTCYKSKIQVSQQSSISATAYNWSAKPSTVTKPVIFDSSSANGYSAASPGISFPDSGCYVITLRVWQGACFDTVSQQVCVERVVPRFSVMNNKDTLNQCAPKFIKFKSTSKNASYHYWAFGDGNGGYVYTDTTDNVYRTNDSCFDVRLVAISANGCQDTLTRYCYIKFVGPVPKFKINKLIGCEPLNVTFTDQSYNIVNRLFDYGNGNTSSSNSSIPSQTYYSPTPGATYDTYIPSLVAYSTLCGSQAYRYPDPSAGHKIDTIKVFKKARAGFYSDSTDVCEPQCVQFYDTSSYAQSWKWYFGDGTTDTVQNPVHCYAPGSYTVSLVANNQAGCFDSIAKVKYITIRPRSKAAFSVNDSVKCKSITVNFTDKSTNTTLRYWDFGGMDTSTLKNPTKTFAPGKYTIKLVTNNAWGCIDSVIKDTLIRVWNNPVPKIYCDTLSGCEPFTTTLYGDSSTYTDSYNWFVNVSGTGVTYNTAIANLPPGVFGPGNWNVFLYTSNVNGCKDSLKLNNYLSVFNRAKPSFTTLDTLGCDTILARFTNNSTFATRYRWNFGDGSPVDTTKNPSHGYGVGNNNVKLWVSNANNCEDSLTIPGRVLVVNKPKPKIWAPDTVACEPFIADLHGDSTLYANSYFWYLGNTNTSTQMNPSEPYVPGVYSVKMVASNAFGCKDSVSKNNYLTVYVKPVADFTTDFTKYCFNQSVIFTDVTISDVPGTTWDWDFGDFTGDNSSAPPPHQYNTPGLKTITLRFENSNGCRDTVVKTDYIYIADSIPPSVSQIQYVTYNNGGIDIFWEQNQDSSFYQNKLYRDNASSPIPPGINIYSSNIRSDVTYTETPPAVDPDNFVYEYSMTTSDSCGWVSQPSIAHRNMVLKGQTYAPMTNLITWTPYVGWGNQLKEYQIWRGTLPIGAPVLELYRTVSASDTFMIDSLLCDSDYFYQVYAMHKTQSWQSYSNQVMNHPPFVSPDTMVSVLKSTVWDNKWTYTAWKPSSHPAIKQYVIDKWEEAKGWQNYYAVAKANVNSFLDVNDVNVNTTPYAYRVSIEDFCGNVSPVSTEFGKTIWLDAGIDNDYVTLKWTPYQYWSNGIREYLVQINYGVNDWRSVATVAAGDTSYIDRNVYEDLFTNYCYRVVAIENDVIPDTSISNIDCAIVPSRIFVPNAFSPNGKNDPRNEVFKPTSLSIYSNMVGDDINDYVFKIYNRWGELVFETHDVSQGWDGTFKGKPCPSDIYLYSIRARGRDGFPYELHDYVHLMR